MDAHEGAGKLLARTKLTPAGCLEFQGYVQSNGYGKATLNNRTVYCHRAVYQQINGQIPAGMDVCHSCDNRRCINPDHLFLGTRRDNMQDAVRKGRQARGLRLPHTKLNESAKAEIVSLARRGTPYKVIAQRFGICPQHAGKLALKEGVRRNGFGK